MLSISFLLMTVKEKYVHNIENLHDKRSPFVFMDHRGKETLG